MKTKNGDIAKARALFDSVANPVNHDRKFKFSDKQMKSLFKKWYRAWKMNMLMKKVRKE